MSNVRAKSKKPKTYVTLRPDSDKLGFLAASFSATAVLFFNLFYLVVAPMEIVFRVVVTFAVTWFAIACLVRNVTYHCMMEIRARKKVKRKQAVAKRQAELDQAEGSEDAMGENAQAGDVPADTETGE